MLEIIDTTKTSAYENMQIDRKLLKTVSNPILHFYEWEKKSITYGVFVDAFFCIAPC